MSVQIMAFQALLKYGTYFSIARFGPFSVQKIRKIDSAHTSKVILPK